MPEEDVARARLRGKRAGVGVVIVVAVAIIGASSFEVVPAVFGAWIRPIPASAGAQGRACARGVLRLERALERAPATAGSPAFGADLQPEWADADEVRQACSASSEGIEAWASLERLRSAEEQLGGRRPEELERLRRQVAAHLGADVVLSGPLPRNDLR